MFKQDKNNNMYEIKENKITWYNLATRAGVHTAEIMESVPDGYTIWNIGNNMPLDYIIFALPKKSKFYWECLIDDSTLKAIKIKKPFNLYNVRNGASRGGTIQELEKTISISPDHYRIKEAKITLEFLKSVTK